jgi:putative membrane protein
MEINQLTGRTEPRYILLATIACLGISAFRPHDYPTWLMEVAPIMIIAPILVASYRSFPLTPLLYRLLFLHALILMVGGHYTYAEVPLGNWMKDVFGFTRNHYDRIGHFAQGFVPAILTREILLRRSPLMPGKWLFFLTASVCLAFSACYELIEWWSAVIGGEAADAFLGTQGDVWDTQWDMFFCLIGALAAQVVMVGLHDQEIRMIDGTVADKWLRP